MLRSSECLAADDVTIRCHVQHSEQASNRDLTEPQEMICTMRVWHKTATPDSAAVIRTVGTNNTRSFDGRFRHKRADHGPELVLTPNESHVMVHACCSGEFSDPIQMSKRFTSFGSGSVDYGQSIRSTSRQRQRISTPITTTSRNSNANLLGEVTIPIADIVVVDMHGKGKSHQCNISTISKGYFEFSPENRNGQDILLTFLRANLPKDRVMGTYNRQGSELSNRSSGTKSFDVEAFTATRMSERLQSETLSEKLRRKVSRVFSSFEDLSIAFTECTCGCSRDSISPEPQREKERRDSPPPNLQYEDDFDHSSRQISGRRFYTSTDVKNNASDATLQRREMMKECQLPSGLSVEASEGP